MRRYLIILLVFLSALTSFSQKDEPLIIYKCDPPSNEIWTILENPAKLKMKTGELENILNQGLNLRNFNADSTWIIYIWIVINCDSTASYELPDKKYFGNQLSLGNQIIEILKSNCAWSPAKSKIELTKRILKKQNKRIVSIDQYTYFLTRFGVGLKLKIHQGKITLESKINTT